MRIHEWVLRAFSCCGTASFHPLDKRPKSWTMNTLSQGRRRHTRSTAAISVQIAFPWGETTPQIPAENMAEEGACIHRQSPVETGTPVLLNLRLPGQRESIECKGRVCWNQLKSNGLHRVGLRFVDLADEERLQLREAVTAQPSAQPSVAPLHRTPVSSVA